MGRKTTVKERWAAVQRWKRHPTWTKKDAVERLGVNRTSLGEWKDVYWDMEEPPATVGDRCRAKGGGRRYKFASYEFDAIQFYDRCLDEDKKVSKDMICEHI